VESDNKDEHNGSDAVPISDAFRNWRTTSPLGGTFTTVQTVPVTVQPDRLRPFT
jgi:hypothetical protein